MHVEQDINREEEVIPFHGIFGRKLSFHLYLISDFQHKKITFTQLKDVKTRFEVNSYSHM